ncbi:S9 family peptidase [Alicyclobacillus sp. SO9]|uniref:S9 family peptidase n=1 Tax=Alicyclobacillus sp. SO9 TaxID=2665646 RepID=UPI0018E86856|nr:S9 family peptidase [Alicyclobacillus sp. SO9]QQE80302.1 S9 family peptidase [Alicyclobacillus sp. SO9]
MNLWTVEELLQIKIPLHMSIAPDERQITYSLKTLDEEKGEFRQKLYRHMLDGEDGAVPITYGSSIETNPEYSPDGKWLAYVSTRQPDEQDEDDEEMPLQRLYLMPLTGGEPKCMTKELGPVHQYHFAPDSNSLFLLTDVEETSFDKERKKAIEEQKRDLTHEERSVTPRRLCRVDISSGDVTTIYPRDYGLHEFFVAENGRQIVFVTNHTGLNNDEDELNLYVLEAPFAKHSTRTDSPQWHKRALIERKGACHTPRVSPDGSQVAFIAPRYEASEHSQSEVWLVPLDGSSPAINVTEKTGFVGDVMDLQWASKNSLLFQAEQGLYSRLFLLSDTDAAKNGSAEVEDVITEPCVVGSFVVHKTGSTVVYSAETETEPPEVFLWKEGMSEPQQLSHWQKPWRDKYRAVVQDYHWQADDGTVMEGLLVLPRESAENEAALGQKWPLIVDIHGGPAWHTTKSFTQYLNFHWLSGLGYAVFHPNYRGGLGYGQDYLYANHHDLGGIDYRDIMSGVDALVAEGLADEERLGVMGGSYGGYMTNWIIGHDHRFKAAVSEFGIWSLMTDFGCSSARGWEVMYLDRYWEQQTLYLERSPAQYVDRITTPVFILHGDEDDNTFIANSKEMYNALLEAGKTVEFVHYPREGHGFREPQHKADEYRKIAKWFGHYLPTKWTEQPAEVMNWRKVDDSVQARVVGASISTEYAGVGEDFERVVVVDIETQRMTQGENESASTSSAGTAGSAQTVADSDSPADKKDSKNLTIANPEDNEVVLLWSGTELYQRPSVLAEDVISPLGWTVPDSSFVVEGTSKLVLYANTTIAKIRLLFPADWIQYGDLSETVLQIKETNYQIDAYL